MKLPKKRKKFPLGKLLVIALLSPVLIVMLLVSLPFAVYQTYVVMVPILRAIELEPLYWLTAFEVKCSSGKGTSDVLETLLKALRYGILECRFRDRETVRRLERILKRPAPSRVYPISPSEVIFFEFRFKEEGSQRSYTPKAFVIPILHPILT